jgi:hypothetical protein
MTRRESQKRRKSERKEEGSIDWRERWKREEKTGDLTRRKGSREK